MSLCQEYKLLYQEGQDSGLFYRTPPVEDDTLLSKTLPTPKYPREPYQPQPGARDDSGLAPMTTVAERCPRPEDVSCPKCSPSHEISDTPYCEAQFGGVVTWKKPTSPFVYIRVNDQLDRGVVIEVGSQNSQVPSGDAHSVQCIRRPVRTLYDISPGQTARPHVMDIDYYIPVHCECPTFDTEYGYGVLLSRDSPLPSTALQLSRNIEFYPLPMGQLLLPPCEIEGALSRYPRSEDLPEELVLPPVEDTGEEEDDVDKYHCPADFQPSCPTCLSAVTEHVLKTLCAAGRGLIVYLKGGGEGELDTHAPWWRPKVTVSQSILNKDYSVKLKMEAKKYPWGRGDSLFRRRRATEEEDVCQQAVDAGPCTDFSTRYYYSSRTGRCEKFKFGGCVGNDNNFQSLQDCRATCEGTHYCLNGTLGVKADLTPVYDPHPERDTVNFYLSSSCDCHFVDYPLGYFLLLMEKTEQIREDENLHLTENVVIVKLPFGKTKLPGCLSHQNSASSPLRKSMVDLI